MNTLTSNISYNHNVDFHYLLFVVTRDKGTVAGGKGLRTLVLTRSLSERRENGDYPKYIKQSHGVAAIVMTF